MKGSRFRPYRRSWRAALVGLLLPLALSSAAQTPLRWEGPSHTVQTQAAVAANAAYNAPTPAFAASMAATKLSKRCERREWSESPAAANHSAHISRAPATRSSGNDVQSGSRASGGAATGTSRSTVIRSASRPGKDPLPKRMSSAEPGWS